MISLNCVVGCPLNTLSGSVPFCVPLLGVSFVGSLGSCQHFARLSTTEGGVGQCPKCLVVERLSGEVSTHIPEYAILYFVSHDEAYGLLIVLFDGLYLLKLAFSAIL